jgi:type I restriction enzyme S subunit
MTAVSKRAFTVWWKDLERWIVPKQFFSAGQLPNGWSIVRVGELVQQIKDRVKVEPQEEYRMVGVKWYGGGIFHRETVKGEALSSTYVTPVIPNAFIYNRLFAWKGSFGVVPEDSRDFFVSNEFPQFIVDKRRILPRYLYLFFMCGGTIKAVNASSIGSAAVSRNRFKEDDFLIFEIPLPPVHIQQVIVSHWEKIQAKINEANQQVEKLKQNSEETLLHELGIQVLPPTPRKGAFELFWKDLGRWDTFFYRKDFADLDEQLSKVRSAPLGQIMNFISRGWNGKDFPEGTFEYIEISSVTKDDGIIGSKTVEVRNAPSRATTLLREGDMILATTRPYLGAFAIVTHEFDGCVCSSGFAVADRLKTDTIDKDFVLLFLKSFAGLRQMERRMTGGLYPAIVQTELEQVLVPLPPLEIQREIVDMMSHYRQQITKERKAAEENKAEVIREVEEMILGIRPVPH